MQNCSFADKAPHPSKSMGRNRVESVQPTLTLNNDKAGSATGYQLIYALLTVLKPLKDSV